MKLHLSQLYLASVLAFTLPLFLAASTLRAAENDATPMITVTATGEAEAAPDLAVITVVIKEQEDTVNEARTKNETKMKKVQDALTQAGVKAESLRILPPSVYVFSPGAMGFAMGNVGGTPKTELVVSSMLLIEVPNPEIPALGNVWKALETALEAGAEVWSSEAANYMPQFEERSAILLTVKDKAALKTAALKKATAAAAAEAEAAAAGLGMKLGEISSVMVDNMGVDSSQVFEVMEAFGGGNAKTGDIKRITVEESATITYHLAK